MSCFDVIDLWAVGWRGGREAVSKTAMKVYLFPFFFNCLFFFFSGVSNVVLERVYREFFLLSMAASAVIGRHGDVEMVHTSAFGFAGC